MVLLPLYCKIVNGFPQPYPSQWLPDKWNFLVFTWLIFDFPVSPQKNHVLGKQIIYKFDQPKAIICILGFPCISNRPKRTKETCSMCFIHPMNVQSIVTRLVTHFLRIGKQISLAKKLISVFFKMSLPSCVSHKSIDL